MLKKVAIICGILIAALTIPGLILCSWFNYQAPKELEAARQRLRDMGAPMTLEEILLPPVPEEQNAAPLYLKLAELVENSPEIKQAEELIEDGIFGDDYSKGPEHIRRMQLSDEEWKTLTKALGLIEETGYFELLSKICSRPHFRPNRDYTQGPATLMSGTLLPSVGSIREAVNFLSYRAAVSYHNNDVTASTSYLKDAFVISEHMAEGQILINILTSLAVRGIAHDSLEAISRSGDHPNSLDLLNFKNSLLNSWLNSIDMERVAIASPLFEALINEGLDEFEALAMSGEAAELRAVAKWNLFGLIDWLFYHDYMAYLNYMADARTAYSLRPYELADLRIRQERAQDKAESDRYVLTQMMAIPTAKPQELIYQSITQDRLATTGLALASYHTDYNRFPETLDTLIPYYLAELPIDPFSGEPLIYKRIDDGFSLYSVGQNLVDDQGFQNYDDRREGDLIWTGFGSKLERIYEEW